MRANGRLCARRVLAFGRRRVQKCRRGRAPSPPPGGRGETVAQTGDSLPFPWPGRQSEPSQIPGGSALSPRSSPNQFTAAGRLARLAASQITPTEAGSRTGGRTGSRTGRYLTLSPCASAPSAASSNPGSPSQPRGGGGCASSVALRWDRAKACAGRRGGLSVTVGRPLGKHPGVSFKRSVMVFWFSCILTLLVLPSKTSFRSFACDTVVTAMVSGG